MQLKKIKSLIEIMDEKNLTKIDYEDKDFKISLEKSNNIEPEEIEKDPLSKPDSLDPVKEITEKVAEQ